MIQHGTHVSESQNNRSRASARNTASFGEPHWCCDCRGGAENAGLYYWLIVAFGPVSTSTTSHMSCRIRAEAPECLTSGASTKYKEYHPFSVRMSKSRKAAGFSDLDTILRLIRVLKQSVKVLCQRSVLQQLFDSHAACGCADLCCRHLFNDKIHNWLSLSKYGCICCIRLVSLCQPRQLSNLIPRLASQIYEACWLCMTPSATVSALSGTCERGLVAAGHSRSLVRAVLAALAAAQLAKMGAGRALGAPQSLPAQVAEVRCACPAAGSTIAL